MHWRCPRVRLSVLNMHTCTHAHMHTCAHAHTRACAPPVVNSGSHYTASLMRAYTHDADALVVRVGVHCAQPAVILQYRVAATGRHTVALIPHPHYTHAAIQHDVYSVQTFIADTRTTASRFLPRFLPRGAWPAVCTCVDGEKPAFELFQRHWRRLLANREHKEKEKERQRGGVWGGGGSGGDRRMVKQGRQQQHCVPH